MYKHQEELTKAFASNAHRTMEVPVKTKIDNSAWKAKIDNSEWKVLPDILTDSPFLAACTALSLFGYARQKIVIVEIVDASGKHFTFGWNGSNELRPMLKIST